MKKLKAVWFVMVMALCLFVSSKGKASASEYKPIFEGVDVSGESGNYYFKLKDERTVYMADTKNGKYVATPMDSSACANGEKAYYLKNGNCLYQYNFKTKKEKKLKDFSGKNDRLFYATISAIRGNNIFLRVGIEEQWRYDTYVFNVAKKKVTKKIKNCAISSVKGGYAVVDPKYRTDVSGGDLYIYMFTKDGLKKVKKLCAYGWDCGAVGKKFYYVKYPNKNEYGSYDMSVGELYRCNLDGSGKEKMTTVHSKSEYSQVIVMKVTSTYFEYWSDECNYRYTFKTKKTEKID